MAAMGRDTVIAVKYHGWWPGANNDPFHLWNVSENTARINMYGVNGVPAMRLDGYLTPPRNVNTLRNQIRSEYNMNCPCTIELGALVQGETSVFFTGSVSADQDIDGLRLFVVLITNYHHAPPQGSNGEVQWFDLFRDMAPNATSGIVLNIDAGQSQSFEGTLNSDASWDVENMHVVAFVQNLTTRQIVQGANVTVSQDYGLFTDATNPTQLMIDPADEELTYTVSLTNIGNLADTYDVTLEGEFPDGWSYTVEAEGVSAHESSIGVPIASLESNDVIVRLNSNGNPGFVDFAVNIQSPNEPLVWAREEYRIMGGLNILLVDDDAGDSFETYFVDAITPYVDELDLVAGRWDVDMDFLDNTYFSSIDVLVWMTGNSFQDGQTLSPLDQLILGDYLDAGGSLFLSGQGIGFDIRTDQFLSDHLHAVYNRNYPQGQALLGVEGDPLTDGLDTPLTGGDGAGNQTRQTALSPIDEFSTVIYDYANSEWSAGLRIATETYRAIYLGFGFEAIASFDVRETLMERSLEWLYGTEAADDNPEALPVAFDLGQNYPNPFNPETTIPFTLAERSIVTLNVYDVLGREVAQLVSGMQEAGSHSLTWNASKLSSGIYFYSLEAVAGDNSYRSASRSAAVDRGGFDACLFFERGLCPAYRDFLPPVVTITRAALFFLFAYGGATNHVYVQQETHLVSAAVSHCCRHAASRSRQQTNSSSLLERNRDRVFRASLRTVPLGNSHRNGPPLAAHASQSHPRESRLGNSGSRL
jgi:hypothetical protein